MTDLDVWGEDRPVGRRGLLFDAGIGLLLGALGAITGTFQSGVAVAVAVLVAAAVVMRRRLPMASAAIGVAAGLTQTFTPDPNAAVVGLGLVTFSLGASRSPRMRRVGLAAAILGVVVAGMWASAWFPGTSSAAARFRGGIGSAALAAVVLLGGWAAGYIRWQRREGIRAQIAERVAAVEEQRLRDLVAQEQDRSRIAADMHDVIAHSWAVVAAQADGARYVLETDPARARAALAVIGATARSAMTDVRLLLDRLRNVDGHDPAEPDLEELIVRLRDSGMRLERERTGVAPHGSPLAPVAARVLAECLTNALKHGDLSEPVHVVEDWGAGYHLEVVNAVRAEQALASGHGLRGVHERVRDFDGTVTAGPSGDAQVWRTTVRIPPEPLVDPEGS